MLRHENDKRKISDDFFKRISDMKQYFDFIQAIVVTLNRNGQIVFINEFGRNLLGKSENEILGKNWFETFLPEEIRKDVFDVFKSLMSGRLSFSEYYENPIVIFDGSQRIISWHNTLLVDKKGRPCGTFSAGIDVTSQRNAEKRLLASLAKIDRYFDFMAHDIANMICPIVIYSELMSSSQDDVPSLNRMELMGKIHEQSQLISRLVLNLRRLEILEKEEAPESFKVNLRKTIKEMIETVRRRYPGKIVRINCVLPRDASIRLPKKECIEMCLECLIDNAMKFSQERVANVKITAHEIKDNKQAPMWEISIEDNGPGLAQDIKSLINAGVSTDNFSRWHLISSLGFVSLLISLCGGQMNAESPARKETPAGTRIVLRFPVLAAICCS